MSAATDFVICCGCRQEFDADTYAFVNYCPDCGTDWIFLVEDRAEADERIAEYDVMIAECARAAGDPE